MSQTYSLGKFLVHATLVAWLMFVLTHLHQQESWWNTQQMNGGAAPLVMQGGNPYIRALMRTISMSESNVPNPYAVIYGGEYAQDLSNHPDRCVSIQIGPNSGRCSTAAGRYQFLSSTWLEKARHYHPRPGGFVLWEHYSFEPQYQDAVVYAWLTDSGAWGVNFSDLLQGGNVDEVFQRLSGTWTSLGYGIESNVMTARLPQMYHQFLQEELTTATVQPGTSLTQNPAGAQPL
jgi:muramidase (phage lysozyme)